MNKSVSNNSMVSQARNVSEQQNQNRSHSHDYEGSSKVYKRGQGAGAITSGQNVIAEVEAENQEDESYYISNSPMKRSGGAHSLNRNHNSKSNAAFGVGSLISVGNQGDNSIQPSNQ